MRAQVFTRYTVHRTESQQSGHQDQQAKQIQEAWINDQLNKEEVSLATFHVIMFPLRKKFSFWHLDSKSDSDIIREEDIQIIRDWRSLDKRGPGEVHRIDYGFHILSITTGPKEIKAIERGSNKQKGIR